MTSPRDREVFEAWGREWQLHRKMKIENRTSGPMPDAAAWHTVSNPARLDSRLRELMGGLEMPAVPGAPAADDPGFHVTSVSAVSRLLGNDSEPLQVGTIVQLAGDPRSHWPLMLLVLETHEGRRVTVVAFSPLSLPASDEELLTGFEVEGLRVISMWNRRCVPVAMLRQLWSVREGSTRLVGEVRRLIAARRNHEPVPADLAERVGPSVFAPDDPRFEYFDEMNEVMDGVLGVAE